MVDGSWDWTKDRKGGIERKEKRPPYPIASKTAVKKTRASQEGLEGFASNVTGKETSNIRNSTQKKGKEIRGSNVCREGYISMLEINKGGVTGLMMEKKSRSSF